MIFEAPDARGEVLSRARTLDATAELVDPTEHRAFDVTGEGEPAELAAEVIVRFQGGYLLRAGGDRHWWMGQLNEVDHSIRCWGQYSDDLERAFSAL